MARRPRHHPTSAASPSSSGTPTSPPPWPTPSYGWRGVGVPPRLGWPDEREMPRIPRLPRANVDPIRSAGDALAVISSVMHHPLVDETVVVYLAEQRLGCHINVVADTGHHDDYSAPLGILAACARLLEGLPALLVGVRCPLDAILQRRRATGWDADRDPTDPIPPPILRWQEAVHTPGIYDLEVDTSLLTPAECAAAIHHRLTSGPPPGALRRLSR